MQKIFSFRNSRIAILCIVSALFLGISLIPLPTRINMDMVGAVVSSNGDIQQQTTFTVSGWKLNFLFLNDQLNIAVNFATPENILKYTKSLKLIDDENAFPYLYANYIAYDPSTNRYTGGNLGLDLENGVCLLSNTDSKLYIIGSVTEILDIEWILNHFSSITG